ncbi:MAG TPA: MoaD/ThiS family protein [Actinomycetota bacterium]|nr:MoaD/ThiS family protein [Actinomycetota bacterium]
MRVTLRNPDREVTTGGGRTVSAVLDELGIPVETVLVIRAGELITRETRLRDDDELEIRPVISGGAR